MMTRHWFTPSTESLLAKRMDLEQQVETLASSQPTPEQQRILRRCTANLEQARALEKPWRPHHPHLMWRYLHRVDEDLILVAPHAEVVAWAQELLASFDMSITEPKVRQIWLGAGGTAGCLQAAIGALNVRDDDAARHVLRQAATMVNGKMDRGYWALSMNTLTAVESAVALGVIMLAFWLLGLGESLATLGKDPVDAQSLAVVALLGLMGGYLSNVLTRVQLLFVPGGPFWRYVLLHLVSRPILSAFGAVLVVLTVRGGVVPAFGAPAGQPSGEGLAFAALALAAGFAGDKLLRSVIGRLLRTLERDAEKTRESTTQPSAA